MSAALKNPDPADLAPRERLRQAHAEQKAILERMAAGTQRLEAAKAKQQACDADLDALAEAERAAWARWEASRGEHPGDTRARRAELTAFSAAAARAVTAALAEYDSVEQKAARDLPLCNFSAAAAARQIMLDEAVRLGSEYAAAVERATKLEAALMGIKAAYSGHDGQAVAVVELALQGGRSPDGAMRRRDEMRKANLVIRARWAGLAERLANDPDATASENLT